MRRRPDTELVVLAREGSAEAAGALFDRYWVLAWRAAYAVTADRGTVDQLNRDSAARREGTQRTGDYGTYRGGGGGARSTGSYRGGGGGGRGGGGRRR